MIIYTDKNGHSFFVFNEGGIMKRYSINSLSQNKCMKIIYDDKKEYINFEITDIDELTPQNIITIKKNLEIINTKLSLLWRDMLDLLSLVNVKDIINKNPNFLTKIKQHLKLGFLENEGIFCLHYKNIPLYKLRFPASVRFAFKSNTEKYISDYKTKKIKIIQNIEEDEKYFRERADIDEKLDVIKKYLDCKAFIYFDNLKIEKYAWININEHTNTLPKIIDFNYDVIIEELNKIPDDVPIKISLAYNNYELIEKISKIYEKIQHKGLRTFLENVNKNGFALGIYLTDVAVPNIQFIMNDEYFKPQSIHDSLRKVHLMYFDFHMNNFKRMLSTNNFGDVVVDEDGNVLDIKPIEDKIMNILLSNNERVSFGYDMSGIAETIVKWELPLIK
jgi:hypothetical protein